MKTSDLALTVPLGKKFVLFRIKNIHAWSVLLDSDVVTQPLGDQLDRLRV